MDRRRPYDYEVGFDACDPLGSVLEWSRDTRAARVVQRRCKSESLERSPYDGEDAFDLHTTLFRTPKSQFTINNGPLECQLPVDETGDFLMGNNDHRKKGSSPPKSPSKTRVKSKPLSPPPHSLTAHTKDKGAQFKRRLPKVEELLDKVEHSILEVSSAKQPLKSILNNHIPMKLLPPQSILKKPKTKPSEAKAPLCRRRQRAASESDHIYCNYRVATNVTPNLFDGRLTYLSTQTKRVKDNSYGYRTTSPPKGAKQKGVNDIDERITEMRLLRTSVINNVVPEDAVMDFPRFDIQVPPCPCPVPPSEPVRQASPSPSEVLAKRGAKKKLKVRNKSNRKPPPDVAINDANTEYDSSSRSPSPPRKCPSLIIEQTKADAINQISKDRLEKLERERQDKLDKITAAINGTSVVKRKEDPENKITKLFNGVTNQPASVAKKPEESPLCIPDQILSVIRQSLFPRVPPYLKFVGHEDPMVKMPLSIQKHLKWKMTTITPIVVKKTLTNSGFRLVKSECDTSECPEEETVDWIGIWGKHMKSIMFRAIKDGQKMNHFPGTFQVGRKDRLWRNLQKLCNKFGLDEFGIMPKTYVLPNDMRLLKHDWDKYAADEERWIIKPPASARGTGIKVVSRWAQIPKKRSVVVQKYINKPYLINGNKFDLRLYVLVTSVHPLRIYLYKDGLARFASVKYTDELSSLNDRYMHLTNYSINRLSKNYTPNEDFNACEGHKWTLHSLFQYLKKEKKIDTDALWISLKDLVIKTIISGEASISSLTKANITSRYNCYELFGIDVLLDEDLKPWLLEVNISPSLHSASPLDIHVKGPLVTTVLNVAQFQIPSKAKVSADAMGAKPDKLAGLPYDNRLYTVYLSKEERDKHIIYTNMEDRETYLRDILSTLTPDDVRHLIQAEDELTQAGEMERIFPTQLTYKYLYYLSGARYYNRLFDAWETRYHRDRAPGIDLLRNLCEIGYHLEVPQVPLKNDIDAPSPPVSEPPSVISIEMVASRTNSQQTTDLSQKISTPTPAPVPVEA